MIPFIEELSVNALPSLQTVVSDGWLIRFSDGYAKRANSVIPLYPSSTEDRLHMDACAAIYSSRNQDTVFKLTSGEVHASLDLTLQNNGYIKEATTHIMTCPLSSVSLRLPNAYEIRMVTTFDEQWFQGYMAMHPLSEKDTAILRTMMQSIVPKTYFVGIYKNDVMVAAGLGVAERGYVGIYHVYVQSGCRREGLGLCIMQALHAAAFKDGFHSAYLQVVADNQGAVALYQGMGYQQIYDYWYRIKKLEGVS